MPVVSGMFFTGTGTHSRQDPLKSKAPLVRRGSGYLPVGKLPLKTTIRQASQDWLGTGSTGI